MPEDKKIRILEALNLCLQEKPFERTTIKDIAGKAAVNHGLLHYYFSSKEDILIHYIDYVIDNYKEQFAEWLRGRDREPVAVKNLIADFFGFMNERITLNQQLSRVFIEIWEIAVYNPAVREKVQTAYREWMSVLAEILGRATTDPEAACRISKATVAFLEGMALFSVLLDPDEFDFQEILTGFQKQIIDLL